MTRYFRYSSAAQEECDKYSCLVPWVLKVYLTKCILFWIHSYKLQHQEFSLLLDTSWSHLHWLMFHLGPVSAGGYISLSSMLIWLLVMGVMSVWQVGCLSINQWKTALYSSQKNTLLSPDWDILGVVYGLYIVFIDLHMSIWARYGNIYFIYFSNIRLSVLLRVAICIHFVLNHILYLVQGARPIKVFNLIHHCIHSCCFMYYHFNNFFWIFPLNRPMVLMSAYVILCLMNAHC